MATCFHQLCSMRKKTTQNQTLSPGISPPDPQFAGAAIIPSAQKFKEEIYFFFSEFNKTARVDEEPYRARIGRICMVTRSPATMLLFPTRSLRVLERLAAPVACQSSIKRAVNLSVREAGQHERFIGLPMI